MIDSASTKAGFQVSRNDDNMKEGHASKKDSSYDDDRHQSALLLLALQTEVEHCTNTSPCFSEDKTKAEKREKNHIFNIRCEELIKFKKKFGHCGVPQKYEENPVLGRWCSSVRKGYNQMARGEKPCMGLSKDRLRRLQEIGFNCEDTSFSASFERRCAELEEFKLKFGHCNVPSHYPDNPKLARWCSQMKTALRQHEKGMKPRYNLSKERIQRLNELNFQWKADFSTTTFEKRYKELIDFIECHGHSNVPKRFKANPALGRWCGNIRSAYSKLQRGQKSAFNLSEDRIELLSRIGFKWKATSK